MLSRAYPTAGAAASTSPALLRPANNMIALVGHSMLARCINVLAVAPNRSVSFNYERNSPAWLAAISRGQLRFPESCKFAVSGSIIKDIYATAITNAVNSYVTGGTQLSNLLACPAAMVYLDTGSNDIGNGYSLARMLSGTGDDNFGLIYVINQIVAAGKVVVLSTQNPRGNTAYTSARYTAAQLLVAHAFRQWVMQDAPLLWPGKVFYVDPWPYMADRAGATLGDIKLGYSEDGIHRNNYAGYLQAQNDLATWKSLGVPPAPPLIHQPADVYNATSNLRGNLLSNGDLLGSTAVNLTQGSVVFSGVSPTGYSFNAGSSLQGGTTVTVKGSQVTGTSTGDWFQMDYSAAATSSSSTPYFSLNCPAPAIANMNAGDILAVFGEWELAAGSTGLCGFSARLSRTFSGGSDRIQVGYGENLQFGGSFDAVLAAATFAGTWNSDLTLLPWAGTETATGLALDCILKDSASNISGSIRVRNVAVRKLV